MGWSDCLDAGSLRRDYALPGSFLILVLDFDDVSSSRDRARDLEQQSRSISHSGFGSAMDRDACTEAVGCFDHAWYRVQDVRQPLVGLCAAWIQATVAEMEIADSWCWVFCPLVFVTLSPLGSCCKGAVVIIFIYVRARALVLPGSLFLFCFWFYRRC
jgi:hypothetical protein